MLGVINSGSWLDNMVPLANYTVANTHEGTKRFIPFLHSFCRLQMILGQAGV